MSFDFIIPFLREKEVDKHAFPKYWPRTNRSVNIIPPINEELTKAITERFGKIYRKMPFKMDILSIEELCNFNVYEKFIGLVKFYLLLICNSIMYWWTQQVGCVTTTKSVTYITSITRLFFNIHKLFFSNMFVKS